MNLFAGLEKFGLKMSEDVSLFEDEKNKAKAGAATGDTKVEDPKEEEFLLEKSVRCFVCDTVFKTKVVKSGRVKRMEPDMDLRPRHMYIDTLKYDVSSCPHCGYTAMNRYFEHLTTGQVKLIKETICQNFKAEPQEDLPTYDYEKAIDIHKLSLLNAMVKKGKTSEKAYNCLVLSWLLRAKAEKLEAEQPDKTDLITECRKEEADFYEQAYEGFMKAVSSEMFPICGMDQTTVDYLLATMSFKFKRYDVASKSLSNVITSPNASRKIKDKALDLKEEILKEIKQSKA